MLLTNNNATKRVGPTLTVTKCVGGGEGSTRFLFVNGHNKVRRELIPRTNFRVGSVAVDKFGEDFSPGDVLRGIGAISEAFASSERTGGVVTRFGPSVYVKANKCISNPIVEATTGVNVPYVVRRRGTCPNVAGGVLTGDIGGMVLTIPSTGGCFSGGISFIVAKGPIERRVLATGGRRSEGRLKLSGHPMILSFNKDLKTEGVGRTITSLITEDNVSNECRRVRTCNDCNS